MKKVLALIVALLWGSVAQAATDTPTSTPTFTPTFTVTPVRQFDHSRARVMAMATDCMNDDQVTRPIPTPLPGSASVYLAQYLSQTSAVLSTGAAKVRISFSVPGNYGGQPKFYAYVATTAAVATSLSLTVNTNVQRFNNGSVINTPYAGAITNVNAPTYVPGRLINSNTSIVRLLLPVSGTAVPVLSGLNRPNVLQPGDTVNLDILRGGGTTTDMYVMKFEMEYKPQPYWNGQ